MNASQQSASGHSEAREQMVAALQRLKTDPAFRQDLKGIESRVRDALLTSGLTENQFEVGSGAGVEHGGPTQEMIRDNPYTCLLMLFDECWLWVKIV